MNLNWYVFETYAGAEWQVHRELTRLRFQSWLPYYLDDVRRGRWKGPKVIPYFEGYVFLKADRKQLRDARKVNGIQGMVTNADGAPAVIAPAVMEELIPRLSPMNQMPVALADAPVMIFEPGVRKKLTFGPFQGLVAEIARVVSFDKVEVWMEAMGHKVKLVVPQGHFAEDIPPQERCA